MGQWGKDLPPEKVREAFKLLGFEDVIEVAVGADLCTIEEAHDFMEEVPDKLPFMGTSCCPAWSEMAKMLYPEYAKCISMALTPMVLTGRLIKKKHPGCKVVSVSYTHLDVYKRQECCRLLGEIRSYSHEQALGEMKRIEKIFQEEAEKAGGSCEADFTVPIQAYRVQETHPCVRRFRRACERLKLPVRLVPTFGGSDQSNLARHGISGLVLASAMEQVHSCAEYTTVSGLETVTELVKLLMQDAE